MLKKNYYKKKYGTSTWRHNDVTVSDSLAFGIWLLLIPALFCIIIVGFCQKMKLIFVLDILSFFFTFNLEIFKPQTQCKKYWVLRALKFYLYKKTTRYGRIIIWYTRYSYFGKSLWLDIICKMVESYGREPTNFFGKIL